jgi:GLPGLI family protein
MNKIFIFIFIFFTLKIFSQTESGKVNYGLVIGYDEKMSNDDILKGYLEQAKEGAKHVSFDLTFNKKESLFYVNESIENENISFAKAFASGNNIFYTHNDSVIKIKFVNNHIGKFIVSYHDNTIWKLENESKYINNFLCYKATSEDIVINSKGTFKHPIVAWYCPSIPFNFGPKGHTGLPGLILELHVRNISWGATKIEISSENKIIEKPTKGKIITEEEFEKILKSPPVFGN